MLWELSHPEGAQSCVSAPYEKKPDDMVLASVQDAFQGRCFGFGVDPRIWRDDISWLGNTTVPPS